MSENNNYETRTNLLSCQDIVAYMWAKSQKEDPSFKPKGSTTFDSQVEWADVQSLEKIKKTYQISKEDLSHSSLTNKEEYEVDVLNFQTFNAQKEICSQGRLLVVYLAIERFYVLFLLSDDDEKAKLRIKLSQKKKLFHFGRETAIEEY